MSCFKLQWYYTRLLFFSLCVHMHYTTGQNWLKFGDKILIPSTMQVRSAIMGCNGRVVLGAYFQTVFSTDLNLA